MRASEIRAARAHDARAIAEVHGVSWDAAYGRLLSPETLARASEVSLDARERSWADRIPRTGSGGYRIETPRSRAMITAA